MLWGFFFKKMNLFDGCVMRYLWIIHGMLYIMTAEIKTIKREQPV